MKKKGFTLIELLGTTYGVGDGNTTFNLPDLRGEFLRWTGINVHSSQGSGSSVGTHQDATELIHMWLVGGGAGLYMWYENDNERVVRYDDSSIASSKSSNNIVRLDKLSLSNNTGRKRYITRPTNTSVLYCIKVK